MVKRPTQTDVARLAGVSRATVSYVLNDRFQGRIPITEKTRQKVLDAAAQLGYQPSALALNLKTGLSQMIGLLMPSIHNPHYWDILEGVEAEVSAHGYHLAIVISNLNLENEIQSVHSLFQQRLDGLILMPTFLDEIRTDLEEIIERKTPAVFVTPVEGTDWVCTDVQSGAVQMMDHLLSLGHRRIGFINGAARPHMSQTREDTYVSAIASAGIPVDESLIRHCGPQMSAGHREAEALLELDDPPTAIWCINDILAIATLQAVHERGLSVPRDVAVAGFDDIQMSRHVYPPLTTVHMPSYEMGRTSAEFLFARIADPSQEVLQATLPAHLIVRQSTVSRATSSDTPTEY